MQRNTVYFWKLLYMFRVVSPHIIKKTHNCIYSIWHLTSARCCRYSCMCAPDDGWRYHTKHVEQFFFYILLTVLLSISLDNDQLDAHFLYFTIRLLYSSTCFEH